MNIIRKEIDMNFQVQVNFGEVVDIINGKKDCLVNWSCDGFVVMVVVCFDQLTKDFLNQITLEQWLDVYVIARAKKREYVMNEAFRKVEKLASSFQDWLMICQKCNGSHFDQAMTERSIPEVVSRAQTLREYIKAFFIASFIIERKISLNRKKICEEILEEIQRLIASAPLKELFECSLLISSPQEDTDIANMLYSRLQTIETTYDEWYKESECCENFIGYPSEKFSLLISCRSNDLFRILHPDF
jgi:hypothetical protein